MELTPSAIAPGDDVTAAGRGCTPGSAVTLKIGDAPVGNAVAASDGSFQAPLTLSALEVGRHDVQAWCGRALAAELDIVLVSSVGSGTATVAVILFFLLLGGWFFGHRLVSRQPAKGRE
ncbi:Ig-like domain repeat protein [Nocardia bhagyanarayanae]|uniref:Ig-like domain repeat protein n=1 Tax=Nocardia bhagyanarayanae TaxID=1215925 RepID=UPI0016395D67|nr:Ig-like domain repeat protein [Nocardia bhagyanarayanae]